MTYSELVKLIDKARADNISYYGDFGFDYILEWYGNEVANIQVTWPRLDSTYLNDAYMFSEALQDFCFCLNRYVGTVVED